MAKPMLIRDVLADGLMLEHYLASGERHHVFWPRTVPGLENCTLSIPIHGEVNAQLSHIMRRLRKSTALSAPCLEVSGGHIGQPLLEMHLEGEFDPAKGIGLLDGLRVHAYRPGMPVSDLTKASSTILNQINRTRLMHALCDHATPDHNPLEPAFHQYCDLIREGRYDPQKASNLIYDQATGALGWIDQISPEGQFTAFHHPHKLAYEKMDDFISGSRLHLKGIVRGNDNALRHDQTPVEQGYLDAYYRFTDLLHDARKKVLNKAPVLSFRHGTGVKLATLGDDASKLFELLESRTVDITR